MLAPPRDLTVPRTTDTLRRVLSVNLRRLATEVTRLPLAPSVQRHLRSQLASSPGRVFAALRRPTVSTLIRCSRGGAPQPLLSDVLAAELGVAVPEHVPCISRAQPTDAFHPIEREIVLATVDVNPLAMREAHPDKSGNAVDLGGHSIERWTASLRRALAIVERDLPVVREEIDLLIQQFVPVGFDEQTHLSASYAEAIGTIYLTLHPNDMTMAEAIVHEHQHNKLNALFDLDPLLQNHASERYASPVRPDPRPLHGILLAVHAFLPVEELYRRLIERGQTRLTERHAQIVRSNRAAAGLLSKHARPTKIGRGILDEIAQLS